MLEIINREKKKTVLVFSPAILRRKVIFDSRSVKVEVSCFKTRPNERWHDLPLQSHVNLDHRQFSTVFIGIIASILAVLQIHLRTYFYSREQRQSLLHVNSRARVEQWKKKKKKTKKKTNFDTHQTKVILDSNNEANNLRLSRIDVCSQRCCYLQNASARTLLIMIRHDILYTLNYAGWCTRDFVFHRQRKQRSVIHAQSVYDTLLCHGFTIAARLLITRRRITLGSESRINVCSRSF